MGTNKYTDITDHVKVLKSNPHYRLGDLVFRRGSRWLYDRKCILTNNEFAHTFLYKYLNSITNALSQPIVEKHNKHVGYGVDDIDHAFKFVRTYAETIEPRITDPRDDTLYVYIRSGDIVGKQTRKNRKDSNIFNHARVIEKIKPYATNVREVVFVTAMHFGDNKHDKLFKYSERDYITNKRLLHRLFTMVHNTYSLNMSIYNSGNSCNYLSTDYDLFKLASCSNIILEPYGGYSDLIMLFRKIIRDENYQDYAFPVSWF